MERSWGNIESAFRKGHIALSEFHELASLLLAEHIVWEKDFHQRREQYEWERNHPVEVPIKDLSRVDILLGLSEAIAQHDIKIRQTEWWQRRLDSGEDVESTHDHWLGHVTFKEVACVLAGVEIGKSHHVSGARRVILHLSNLVALGFVARHYENGASAQKGWSLTELGEREIARIKAEIKADD